MQAVFRFRGDEEIEVFTDGAGVNVWHRVGIKPGDDATRYVEREHRLALSKTQARSLASAIMGAAAEL